MKKKPLKVIVGNVGIKGLKNIPLANKNQGDSVRLSENGRRVYTVIQLSGAWVTIQDKSGAYFSLKSSSPCWDA